MQSSPFEKYQIGIICALPKELRAVKAILDEKHEPLRSKDVTDHNSYVLGRVGEHNVVAAGLPAGVYGMTSAASVGKDMLRTFSQLRFGLLVGIAGGIPDIEAKRDVRLGDVVVSQPDATHGGMIQYDLGKLLDHGQLVRKGTLNKPPQTLLTALTNLQADLDDEDSVDRYLKEVDQKRPRLKEKGYYYQGMDGDQLHCTRCDPSRWWWALWTLIVWLWPLWRCDRCDNGAVIRSRRSDTKPVIHYGTIASGNTILKNASRRDQLARELGALCVEMEAAGLDDYPCLVIRGICDYADAYKNDNWQEYAALTAAAFTKALLQKISVEAVREERPAQQALDILNEHFGQLHTHHAQHEAHLQRQETRYQSDKQRDCHRAFKTSNYEQHKNINPTRMPGTCRWLLDHSKYQQWRENRRGDLLWISADPGCGKSVLSRLFVDEDLRDHGSDSNVTRCYFFFKDNDIQDGLAVALCAVLHQLFDHQPQLIRYALRAWEKNGGKIASEVDEMWRILLAAMTDQEAEPVICVLDALDECRDADRKRLILMLCQFYNGAAGSSSGDGKLKFLVTSRPYEDIEHHFGRIATSLPSIRLRGEDKNDQIHREIDSVVQAQVREIARDYHLTSRTVERLEQKLLAMEHRTYLWLYLAIDSVRDALSQSLRPDDESIELLPTSIDDAYEQILSKVSPRQIKQVRLILSIIVGARRPLSIGEMALALGVATSKTIPQSVSDLDVKEDQLLSRIRHWCGLFVFINHSRLYLIHQTAKEFLLNDVQRAWIDDGKWKCCLSVVDVECKIARVYILYLCLKEFDALELNVGAHQQKLFELAAESWADHWRRAESAAKEEFKDKAWLLYSTQSRRFSRWTEVMWHTQRPYEDNPDMNKLVLAAFNGHVEITHLILNTDSQAIKARDKKGNTALIRGAEMGHYDTVALLLRAGADVNAQGGDYGSALQAASARGHEKVVQILLEAGADVNAQGGDYGNALQAASADGHEKVVQILLEAGADVNAQGGDYGSALQAASASGREKVVQILLEAGADVNAQEEHFGSALQAALANGHEKVVQILFKAGADVNAQGGRYGSALQAASLNSREEVVQILLEAGADVNAQGRRYGSALQAASIRGREKVVQILLEAGADVNAQGGDYGSALQAASSRGREKVVQILLEAGADVNAQGGRYGSALQAALHEEYMLIVQLLYKYGATDIYDYAREFFDSLDT